MFISCKQKFIVKRADGTWYTIPNGYLGDIPDDVAQSRTVQLAIKGGQIVTPDSHKDKDIEAAEAKPKKAKKKKE